MNPKEEYRHVRKLMRDKLYRARKSGSILRAGDLPPIPENPTEQDIENLIEATNELLTAEQGQYDYADDDTAYFSELAEITNRLWNSIGERVENVDWLQAKDHHVKIGGPRSPLVPYFNIKEDKEELLNIWRDTLVENTTNIDDARELDYYIQEHMEQISDLLTMIETVTYYLDEYNADRYTLMNILSYNRQITLENVRKSTTTKNDYISEPTFDPLEQLNMDEY